MVTKKVCSQREYEEQRTNVAALKIRLEEEQKYLRQLQVRKRKKNCPECHGNKQVAIGNIGGVYGYCSGDNGYETCKKCKGKGYK